MKVTIRSVADKGDIERERLILEVSSSTDIGDFALCRAGYSNGSVTTGIRNTLWFPYKTVSKGDVVVLYTKFGKANEKIRNDGSTSHFFYWGLKVPIWQNEDSAPVLLYAPEWESKEPHEL